VRVVRPGEPLPTPATPRARALETEGIPATPARGQDGRSFLTARPMRAVETETTLCTGDGREFLRPLRLARLRGAPVVVRQPAQTQVARECFAETTALAWPGGAARDGAR